MGGARYYPYPKWVWSPAGGWWHNPTHWRRNLGFTLAAAGGAFAALYAIGENSSGYIDNIGMTIHYPPTDTRARLQRASESDRLKSSYTFEHTIGSQSKLVESDE